MSGVVDGFKAVGVEIVHEQLAQLVDQGLVVFVGHGLAQGEPWGISSAWCVQKGRVTTS